MVDICTIAAKIFLTVFNRTTSPYQKHLSPKNKLNTVGWNKVNLLQELILVLLLKSAIEALHFFPNFFFFLNKTIYLFSTHSMKGDIYLWKARYCELSQLQYSNGQIQ